jgi:hypothetical protein
MPEHSINLGHYFQLHDTSILAKRFRHVVQIIMEALVIKLHFNMYRDDGFSLSKLWKPDIHALKNEIGLSLRTSHVMHF